MVINKKWFKKALEILSPRNVERFRPVLEKEADYLVDLLMSETQTHGSIDPFKPVQSASMNFILITCLGRQPVRSHNDPLFRELVRMLDRGMKMAGAAYSLSAYLPIFSIMDLVLRREKYMKHIVENERNVLFKRLIKEALEGEADCLLKSLYAVKDRYGLDDETIMVTVSK